MILNQGATAPKRAMRSFQGCCGVPCNVSTLQFCDSYVVALFGCYMLKGFIWMGFILSGKRLKAGLQRGLQRGLHVPVSLHLAGVHATWWCEVPDSGDGGHLPCGDHSREAWSSGTEVTCWGKQRYRDLWGQGVLLQTVIMPAYHWNQL